MSGFWQQRTLKTRIITANALNVKQPAAGDIFLILHLKMPREGTFWGVLKSYWGVMTLLPPLATALVKLSEIC